MKKILFFVSLMFFAFSVRALEPTLFYQNNIYSNRIGPENKIWSGQMAFIFMGEQIVYCLDPYLVVGNDYMINKDYYLSNEDLEYYSIISYYGYNSTTRNNIYYYMAAQELIWEHMIGKGNVFWTTGQYNTGQRIDISQYKSEIENDINEFYKKPLLFDEYQLSSFENLLIHDENKALYLYDMYKRGNSDIIKDGNNLLITMYDSNSAEIILKKQIKNNVITQIYSSPGKQTLGQFGIDKKDEINIKVKLEYFKTNAYLNFYDEITGEKIDDITFSICNLDIKINKTDKGYQINNIKEGTYKLCDLDKYEDKSFEITKDEYTQETYINVYIKPKKKIELNENTKNTYKEKEVENNFSLEKNEIKDIIPNEIVISELPNTYDYETPIYLFLISILVGSVFYKIK